MTAAWTTRITWRRCLATCAALLVLVGLAAARADDPPAAQTAPARRELAILFVGNSYTYVNDLPARLVELAKDDARGPTIRTESVTPGGATMAQHHATSGALAKIRAGGFTHVVLQGQSLEPLTRPAEFSEFARKLCDEAEKAGAQVVLYQTWARRDKAAEYAESWSGGTPKRMQKALNEAYAKVAEGTRARIARVGEAWAAALARPKPPELFDADGSHPALAGTFLAACVFYETITDGDVRKREVAPEGLDAKLAKDLRAIAHGLRER